MSEHKNRSIYDLPIEVLYPQKPAIQANNWEKWLEYCSVEEKKLIAKVRNAYSDIEKLDIRVFEVIEPLGNDGYWIEQYPYDYIRKTNPELHEYSVPYVIFVFKVDEKLHLNIDSERGIECEMHNFTEHCGKQFAEYVFVNFLGCFHYALNVLHILF